MTNFSRLRAGVAFLGIAVGAYLVPIAPCVFAAAAPAATVGDADAVTVVKGMIATHRAMKTYAASMKLTIRQGVNSQSIESKIAYAKPNKVSVSVKDPIQGGTRLFVSDGTAYYYTSTSAKNVYHKTAAAPDADAIHKALTDSKAFASPAFALLVTDPDAEPSLLADAKSLKVQKDTKIDNVPVDVVLLTFKSSPQTIAFAVGKEDHLLRRFTYTLKDNGVEQSFTEEYKDVKANTELPASTFTFSPEKGMKEIAE